MKKILALNNLMLVAKYLNKNWVPEFNRYRQAKYYITISDNKLSIDRCYCVNKGAGIFFRMEELAQQAIELLGEETIKLALSPNY